MRYHVPVPSVVIILCALAALGPANRAPAQEPHPPENMRLLSEFDLFPLGPFDVSSPTVYLIESEYRKAANLVVADLNDPTSPRLLYHRPLAFDAEIARFASVYGLGFIRVRGAHLYIATKDHGLQVYNVANPAAPIYVGRLAAYDAQRPEMIDLEGDRLYFGGEQLRIYAFDGPTSLTELAALPIPSSLIDVDQGRIVVASESYRGTMKVYDVRDPANPLDLGALDYAQSGFESAHGLPNLRWPQVAMLSYWTEPNTADGNHKLLNVYTHRGASWDRLQGVTDTGELEHAHGLLLGATALYGSGPFSLTIFNTSGTQLLHTAPAPADRLLLQDGQLYAEGDARLNVFDVAGTSVTLAGTWNAAKGVDVIVAKGRAYFRDFLPPPAVLDVSDPTSPSYVGQSRDLLGNAFADAETRGDWLYAARSGVGLQIISLANPDDPRVVGVALPGMGVSDFVTSGNLAFVLVHVRTGQANYETDLRIADLTSKATPREIGFLDFGATPLFDLVRYGNYLYANSIGGRGSTVHIVDVSNPQSPFLVKSFTSGAEGRLFVAGPYLCELGNINQSKGVVYDLADPTSPVERNRNFPSGKMLREGPNGWIYVAGWSSGLYFDTMQAWYIADIDNPWLGGLYPIAGDEMSFWAVGNLLFVPETSLKILQFDPPEAVNLRSQNFGLGAPALSAGEVINFSGSVVNDGPGGTSSTFTVAFMGVPMDGGLTSVPLCDPMEVAGLAAGGAVSFGGLGLTLYAPEQGPVPGNYRVAIVIDSDQEISERFESDNVWFAQSVLTVTGSLNDLHPRQFGFSPNQVAPGQEIRLTGEVVSTGTRATAQGFWLEFRYSPNADFSPPCYLLCQPLWIAGGLTPGTPKAFDIRRYVFMREAVEDGPFVVGAIVDPLDDFPEADETNNVLWVNTGTLTISRSQAGTRRWALYW